jgi:hypothetical protein
MSEENAPVEGETPTREQQRQADEESEKRYYINEWPNGQRPKPRITR